MKKFLMVLGSVLMSVSMWAQQANLEEIGDSNMTLSADMQEQIHYAEVLTKYAGKSGFHLIEGSLASFKDKTTTMKVVFDWSLAKAANAELQDDKGQQAKENSVPVDECIKEYEDKFVVYFNAHSKDIKLDTDDENAPYILTIKPISYVYRQMKVLGNGTTIVGVSGFLTVGEKDGTAKVAEYYFGYNTNFSTKLGSGGVNTENTLKCWRIVAENLDNALLKALKKGK